MIIGCDVSTWQDRNDTPNKIDFKKMKATGASFVFCRASFGSYQDTDFADYWTAAKDAELPRGAYTFPLTSLSMADQIQKFLNIIKNDPGEIPPVLDIERYQSTVPNAASIKTAIKMIEDQLGVKPIIYTGFYVWRDEVKGSNDAYFARYPLWIANYGAVTPLIPKPWTTWTFWQYTDKGDGPKYGTESLNVDMDYFAGELLDFNAFLGIPTPAPVNFTDQEKLDRLWNLHPELWR
jgi:lysozyme